MKDADSPRMIERENNNLVLDRDDALQDINNFILDSVKNKNKNTTNINQDDNNNNDNNNDDNNNNNNNDNNYQLLDNSR